MAGIVYCYFSPREGYSFEWYEQLANYWHANMYLSFAKTTKKMKKKLFIF